MISAVIPTFNREGILKKTLQEFNHQTLDGFEVVVVNDGGDDIHLNQDNYNFDIKYTYQDNSGPAAARNRGVEEAKYDIVLFMGDDCIPDKDLLWRHYYNHQRDRGERYVQGYTKWHPLIATDPFHQFLDASGLQANWNGLRNDDGSWMHEMRGYCLTTNFSIHKTVFNNCRGFSEKFKEAAYEDISLGHKLALAEYKGVFDPGAVNYHYHHYDLESFVQRQLKEGYWRIELCYEFPELAHQMIPPEELREARKLELEPYIKWANELRYVHGDDAKEAQYGRWSHTLRIASLKGILNRIDNDHPALQALEHIHSSEQVIHVINGVAGIKRGDLAYAQHCVGWLMGVGNSAENWACHCFSAEIFKESGDIMRAKESYRESIKQAPNDWAQEALEELR